MAKLPLKTGTENPATSGQLEATSKRGSANPEGISQKTGYAVKSAPKYAPAIDTKEHSGGAKQHVKGKHGKDAPAESKPVAGQSR